MSEPLVHLIDGHVYIFRAYYSMPEMQAPDGTPTGAAYGYANTLIKYLRDENPTHIAVCFDHALTSFRNEIDPGYKADRVEAPDDLEPQFDICAEITEVLGLHAVEIEDFEADDLLATLATRLASRGARVRVVTSDKDLAQLVTEDGRVSLYDLARERHMDAAGVRERFGVSPHQIPDYLALVGDAVDNLPGVPRVGPKSAAAILTAFGSLEKIPADPDAWKGVNVRGAAGLAHRIREHRAQALQTRGLATLVRNVPGVRADLRWLAYRGADAQHVGEVFGRLGWEGIATRVVVTS